MAVSVMILVKMRVFLLHYPFLAAAYLVRVPEMRPTKQCGAASRGSPRMCQPSPVESSAYAAISSTSGATPSFEATATYGPDSSLDRRIFCNRALNMAQIQAVGFDLDYTLAEYKIAFDLLAYDGAVRKLIAMGYPKEVASFKYDPKRYQRGLLIDKQRGNVLKLDRHKYVKVAYHGLSKLESAERKAIYARSFEAQPTFSPPEYASIDTDFLLVDVCLFCQLVDLKDRFPEQLLQSYATIYQQVRRAVDLCHCDGEIKDPVAVEPAKYIYESPELAAMLSQLKLGGKQVFLLTNSLYDYTKVVLEFLLGPLWLNFFDLVICGARKPGFLLDPYLPIFRVNTADASLQNIEMGSEALAQRALSEGKVFQGGNWNHLHRMLRLQTGSALMYVGDHMYSDILRSKRTLGWRTVLMVPELCHEVSMLERSEGERALAVLSCPLQPPPFPIAAHLASQLLLPFRRRTARDSAAAPGTRGARLAVEAAATTPHRGARLRRGDECRCRCRRQSCCGSRCC